MKKLKEYINGIPLVLKIAQFSFILSFIYFIVAITMINMFEVIDSIFIIIVSSLLLIISCIMYNRLNLIIYNILLIYLVIIILLVAK